MANHSARTSSFTASIQPTIVSYNNPKVLRVSLERLSSLPFKFRRPVIIDNNSPSESIHEIYSIARFFDCTIIGLPVNLGWGGAINYCLDNHWQTLSMDDCILMVMAHDCYFTDFDPEEVAGYFEDSQAIFVCPDYPSSVTSHYNIFRSYYSKPGKAEGLIRIGHQTAFFTRPSNLRKVRFDEEFWLYGGEYEIFTRAHKAGLRSYQAVRTVVVNPSSDSSAEHCLLSWKLNSLYISRKRHGYIGLYLRLISLIATAFILFIKGQQRLSRYIFSCMSFAFSNPGCGLLSYRSLPVMQSKYKIVPLDP